VVQRVKEANIQLIRFQWIGNDLIQRALVTTAAYLESHLDTGIGVTKGMQSFNVLDQTVKEGSFGPESSEFRLVPDLETYAPVPYAPGNARLIAELFDLDLKPSLTDGRYALRRVVTQAKKMGLTPYASLEPEYYLLNQIDGKPSQFIRERFGTSHSYDLLGDYLCELTSSLSAMNVSVERIKKEYGGSQIEPTLRYTHALKAADDFVTLRDVAKGVSVKRGLLASFMPKPFSDSSGSGLHLHLSLFNSEGTANAFFDEGDPKGLGMSRLARHFVGGVLKHINAITVFAAPTTNSYKRLRPGSWATSHIFWGFDNRAAAIRIPSSVKRNEAKEKRIEFRLGDPSANPYLYLAATLAAGLDGVEHGVEPPDPLCIDPSKVSESRLEELGVSPLPATLGEALSHAESDQWLRSVLGEQLVNEYLKMRRSEWRSFCEHVCEWETANYIGAF
jgi:glutamine synthetase